MADSIRRIDWSLVGALVSRELRLVLRGKDWARTVARSVAPITLLALFMVLQSGALAVNRGPSRLTGVNVWLLLLALSVAWSMGTLTARRVRAEMPGGALDELLLAGCTPPLVLTAKCIAHGLGAVFLVAAFLPSLLLVTAVKGLPPTSALLIAFTLLGCAGIGVLSGLETVLPGTSVVFRTLGLLILFRTAVQAGISPALFSSPIGSWLARILFFHPLLTLISTLDHRPRGWIEGMVVWLLYLVVMAWVIILRSRKDWKSHTPVWEAIVANIAGGKDSRWRPGADIVDGNSRWAKFVRRMAERSDPRFAISWLSLRTTSQFAVGWGILLPTFFLMPKTLKIPGGETFRPIAVYLLWTTCAMAAHHAGEALARDRTQGRWSDLALLPVSNRDLLVGKLLPPLRSVVAPWLLSLIALVVAAWFSPTLVDRPDWYLCVLAALGVLPPLHLLLGAILGLRAPSSGEAHWQIGIWITAFPYLLLLVMIFAGHLPVLFALSPLAGLIRCAAEARVAAGMWAGLALAPLLAVCLWKLLSLQLRRWALAF